jgi:DMSO/TMAO reductase YedYZ heme-binding membrane subunit
VDRAQRLAARSLLAVVGLGIVAMPPVIIGLSHTASTDPLWTALRLVALEAFTLIFANIVIGAFRPLLNRVFKPARLQDAHMATGIAGFTLALAHGLMVFVLGLSGYRLGAVWIGPVAVVLLIVVITTALTRRRLRAAWRWIHRLNYVIFVAVLVHGLILGYDLRGQLFLKVCFAIYAAVVICGLGYRLLARRPKPAVRKA